MRSLISATVQLVERRGVRSRHLVRVVELEINAPQAALVPRIQRGADHDAPHPAGEGGRLALLVELLKYLDERVLQGVLGVGQRWGVALRHHHHRPHEAVVERPLRGRLAAAAARQQLGQTRNDGRRRGGSRHRKGKVTSAAPEARLVVAPSGRPTPGKGCKPTQKKTSPARRVRGRPGTNLLRGARDASAPPADAYLRHRPARSGARRKRREPGQQSVGRTSRHRPGPVGYRCTPRGPAHRRSSPPRRQP